MSFQQCDGCPLVQQCMARPGVGAFGKVVHKNQYEREYQRVRQRALTEEYAAVRQQHAAVERKLNEVLNHHGGRHAQYWGRSKVLMQEYMTCFTVNFKRLGSLLRRPARAGA
ncbi:MAG: transposase [Pirellulaceae bacterium]